MFGDFSFEPKTINNKTIGSFTLILITHSACKKIKYKINHEILTAQNSFLCGLATNDKEEIK